MIRPGMKLAAAVALAALFTTSIAEHDHSHVHSHGHDHGHDHGHSHDRDYHDHRHVHHGHHDHEDHHDGRDSRAKQAVVEVAVDDVGNAHHADHSSLHGDHGHAHQHDDDHGHSHDHRDLRRPIPGPVETVASPSTEDRDHDHEHANKHDHDHKHEHEQDHAHKHEHDHAHASHSSLHHSHDHAHDHPSHDQSHSHAHHGHTDAARLLEGTLAADRFDVSLWVEALSATALVGLAPVILLFFIPLGRASLTSQKPLLRIFLAFAAGGLLGDALLHLLPHSIPSGHHDHDHSHDHSSEAGHSHSVADLAPYLWTLAGLITFLMLEKFVRAQTGGHGHSHGAAPEPKPSKKTAKADKDEEAPVPVIAAAAYLNLAADFSHNFTDGLAIGATFVHGRSSGWQTTLAMLLHEVPHEIGDFAILIQSGFTRSEAMWTQVYTALGAMVGTAVGLLIEAKTAAWITPFTAGGFVYIACTSVFPELLEDSSLVQSLLQLVAMGTGVALMLLIALYE